MPSFKHRQGPINLLWRSEAYLCCPSPSDQHSDSSINRHWQDEHSQYLDSYVYNDAYKKTMGKDSHLQRSHTYHDSRTGNMAIPSLDAILRGEAMEPFTLSKFREHLEKEHSSEGLRFLIDAEKYERKFNDLGSSEEHLCQLWDRIILKYIKVGSIDELNLPCEIREQILQDSEYEPEAPQPSILDAARQQTRQSLRENGYFTFVRDIIKLEENSPEMRGHDYDIEEDEDEQENDGEDQREENEKEITKVVKKRLNKNRISFLFEHIVPPSLSKSHKSSKKFQSRSSHELFTRPFGSNTSVPSTRSSPALSDASISSSMWKRISLKWKSTL